MAKKEDNEMDSLFLWLTVVLTIFGFLVFISASLGLYAHEGLSLMAAGTSQFLFGLVGGLIAMWVVSKIHYSFWRRYAVPIFLLTLAITALVFVPGLGYTSNGATRWISLGFTSFQPAELLKVGFVISFAAWCSYAGVKMKTLLYGVLPFTIFLLLVAGVLLMQPDTGTFIVIGLTSAAMMIVAGARWLHLAGITAVAAGGLAIFAYIRPYIQERLMTFMNPAMDPYGAGYQIQQSLIAIGSGKWLGRGMGQSIQKFNFVPEPVGDSIFAIFAEEWGFIGAIVLIGLFLALALRGYRIAADSPTKFSRLLVVGLVTLIAAQSFVNIGAMIGLLPLTGLPLIFVSHGGTALFTALASVGIILNVSRYT